jgi:hypothetical protein
MIEVKNLLHCKDFGKPGDFRCDRETKWGNPFIMYEQHMRDRVCDLYEDYLDAIIESGNETMVRTMLKIGGLTPTQVDMWMLKTGGYLDINELKGAKRLFCWCKNDENGPRCHCDYLKKVIEGQSDLKCQ